MGLRSPAFSCGFCVGQSVPYRIARSPTDFHSQLLSFGEVEKAGGLSILSFAELIGRPSSLPINPSSSAPFHVKRAASRSKAPRDFAAPEARKESRNILRTDFDHERTSWSTLVHVNTREIHSRYQLGGVEMPTRTHALSPCGSALWPFDKQACGQTSAFFLSTCPINFQTFRDERELPIDNTMTSSLFLSTYL